MADPIPVNDLPDYVRNATYGRDVREALAQACEYVKTVYNTSLKSTDVADVSETTNYLGITHS